MIQPEKITEAVNLLSQASRAKKIILFGSYARGDMTPDSDVDFLVVEESVPDRFAEMVRLRRVLSPLRIPVDVIVTSEKKFSEWCTTPGNLFYEVAAEGKVLYETT